MERDLTLQLMRLVGKEPGDGWGTKAFYQQLKCIDFTELYERQEARAKACWADAEYWGNYVCFKTLRSDGYSHVVVNGKKSPYSKHGAWLF